MPEVINSKFRNNLKADQLKRLVAMKEEAAKWADILKKTGLSHSKAELAWMEHEAFVQSDPKFKVAPLTGDFVAYARTELGLGWGPIMVWTQSSEGSVRKAFKEATGTHSDGQRVGRGGRFKFDEPDLYVGELKPTGTDIPADKALVREVARDAAFTTRLGKLEFGAVKAIYEEYTGTKVKRGATKAKLIVDLAKLNNAKVSVKEAGSAPKAEPSAKASA